MSFLSQAAAAGHRGPNRAVCLRPASKTVIEACTRYVQDHKESVRSELGKQAVSELLKPDTWVMYSHGLDVLEIVHPMVLHTGNALAFGPDFDIEEQGFCDFTKRTSS